MRFFRCIAIAVPLLLSACAISPTENPLVAERCTYSRDLLTKNLRASGTLDLYVIGANGYFERSAGELSGAAQTRIYELDLACRAWVLNPKAFGDDEYAKVLLAYLGGSAIQGPDGLISAQIANEIKAAIAAQQKAGNAPKDIGEADIDRALAANRGKSPRAVLDNMGGIWAASVSVAGIRETLPSPLMLNLFDRLSAIEKALIERSQPPPIASAVDDPYREVRAYFAVGSQTLAGRDLTEVRNAAALWAKQGISVTVDAYSDPRGRPEANAILSLARARWVADVLKANSVLVLRHQGHLTRPDPTEQYDDNRVVVISPLRNETSSAGTTRPR